MSHVDLNAFPVFVCADLHGSLTECVQKAAFPRISGSRDDHLHAAA